MKEPCKTCPEKEKDLGGCRCQAYMLSGDPTLADPICDKSPHHHIVKQVVKDAENFSPEEKPIAAKKAMLTSRINTLLSLPMLLTMVAAQNLY